MYITPIGDEETPDGDNIYLEDLPLDLILDTYGIDLYKDEYKRRFLKKPNMNIFKNIAHENLRVEQPNRQDSIPVFGLRKTESIQQQVVGQIKEAADKIDNLDDLSDYQSKDDDELHRSHDIDSSGKLPLFHV
jgi:hypothetical protein